MSKTYMSSLKKDAVVQVPMSTEDIAKLHSILLKHLDSQISLDDRSWETIERLCSKIDKCADKQNLTELKEVNF
jgi:RNA:NAD 2'-phosphotransferase (TPT1/KptA family)